MVDTNFINFSIKAILNWVQSMMGCLYAKGIPCITDCEMAETEKLGQKYPVALRIAKETQDLNNCLAQTKESVQMTA